MDNTLKWNSWRANVKVRKSLSEKIHLLPSMLTDCLFRFDWAEYKCLLLFLWLSFQYGNWNSSKKKRISKATRINAIHKSVWQSKLKIIRCHKSNFLHEFLPIVPNALIIICVIQIRYIQSNIRADQATTAVTT